MITECYVKGRLDYGIGKSAVVIVEGDTILYKIAWVTPHFWLYKGEQIVADQYNCELLAATYALKWCKEHGKKVINIYTNNKAVSSWYNKLEFPENRVMGRAFLEEAINIGDIFSEFIPKNSDNDYNLLLNQIAEQVK